MAERTFGWVQEAYKISSLNYQFSFACTGIEIRENIIPNVFLIL